MKVAPAIRQTSPSAARPENRGTSTPMTPAKLFFPRKHRFAYEKDGGIGRFAEGLDTKVHAVGPDDLLAGTRFG